MSRTQRALLAAWIGVCILWFFIRPIKASTHGEYVLSSGVSASLLVWCTAALAAITFYQLSSSLFRIPSVKLPRFRTLVIVATVCTLLAGTVAAVWLLRLLSINRRAFAAIEMGDSSAKAKDRQTAIACYSKAIELKPGLAKAYLQRGKVLEDVWPKGHDDAIKDYTKVISLEPENSEAYYLRGVTYFGIVQHSKGIADLSEAIRLKPDYAEAYRYRGSMMFDEGDSSSAITDLSRAVELGPSDSANWYWRSLIYQRMGKLDLAASDATQAIHLLPNRDNYWLRAKIRNDQGKVKEAITDYTSAIALDSDNQHLLRERASLWLKAGNLEEANKDKNSIGEIERRDKATKAQTFSEEDAAKTNAALRAKRNQ